MSAQRKKTNVSIPLSFRLWAKVAVVGALLVAMIGCNEYPLQLLKAIPYTEVTDYQTVLSNQLVDILFVVDNSNSMEEEQEKLARNFELFIDGLTSKNLGNYQIGVISTDMNDPLQSGKLQGTPRIINRGELSKANIVEAFKKNIRLGTRGTSYEKALDAMRAALSPTLLNDEHGNKGFLRPGALLVIIFVGDEDDCSHDGSIRENELDSEVCRYPRSHKLVDNDGNPILDFKGEPTTGHMEALTPVSTYIDFLKSLDRKVIVAGLIGDPIVYRDSAAKVLVDPQGGCQKDIECSWQGQTHRCLYNSPSTRRCGSCYADDAKTVSPGFRLYEVIKAFGGSDYWFPICGDDSGFQEALTRFVQLIEFSVKKIPLTRAPVDPNALTVKIVFENGNSPLVIPKATPFSPTRSCAVDEDCGGSFVCGSDSQCYGDGWVYIVENGRPGALALSGNAKSSVGPGARVNVSYSAK